MSTLASVIVRDVIANRPAATTAGALFFATDTSVAYRANGSTWDEVIPPQLSNAGAYDAAVTYSLNKFVSYAGSSWVSLQDSNLAHQPDSSPTWWSLFVQKGADPAIATTSAAGIVKPDGTTITVDGAGAIAVGAIAESAVTNLTTDLAAKVPTTRTVSTTAPLTGGGALSANLTLAISNFTGDAGSGGTKGAVPAPASGDGTTKFLKADGTWAIPSGTATGTVTSIGLTMPSEFTVASSPVTTSGTIAVTRTTQSANQVMAGPSSGSAAAPTFRALVAADIPALPESAITNLTTDLAAKAPTTRTLTTTAPLTGGGDLSADRTLGINAFTGDSGAGGAKGAVPAPASGDAAAGKFLKADGTWAAPSTGTVDLATQVTGNLGITHLNSGTSASGATFWCGDGTWSVPAGNFSSPLTTKGDLLVHSTSDTRFPVGTDGQFLVADSTQTAGLKWSTRSVKPGWSIGSGAAGTAVGRRVVATSAGIITTCLLVVDASDATTDLTINIKKNGTSIFTAAQTITHGASTGSVTDLTSALASNPISTAKSDVFQLDITAGSTSWQFSVVTG